MSQRWVSLAMLCPNTTDLNNLTLQIQSHFLYNVQMTKMQSFDSGTNFLIHWDRIKIHDDDNVHDKLRTIQTNIGSNNLLIFEIGVDKTFWVQHTSTIITFIGGASLSLFFYFFPNS